MFSDARIAAGSARLVNGKLTESDVDNLVSAFRMLVGPLEEVYKYDFETDLRAVDDTGNTKQKAAKLAAVVLALGDEDFDVDILDADLKSNARDQRALFIIAGFSLLYQIPIELMDSDVYKRYFIGAASTGSVNRFTAL